MKFSKRTPQGDPVAMTINALSVIPLMLIVLEITNTKTKPDAKMAAYAVEFSAAGSISSLKYWWDALRKLVRNSVIFLSLQNHG